MSPHILSQAGFKTSGCYTERVSSFEPVHMLVERQYYYEPLILWTVHKRQYCPSKRPSPDGILVFLMCGGYMEQLRWSGPGSTLRYVHGAGSSRADRRSPPFHTGYCGRMTHRTWNAVFQDCWHWIVVVDPDTRDSWTAETCLWT